MMKSDIRLLTAGGEYEPYEIIVLELELVKVVVELVEVVMVEVL